MSDTPFEENLRRLEAIVDALDAGELELDAALTLFEEGVDVLKNASVALAAAEARVTSLVEQANGLFETPDFNV